MLDGPTNTDRANTARNIIAQYKSLSGLALSDDEALRDLITDLGHFSDHQHLDFVRCAERAIAAWKVEKTDPIGLEDAPDITIKGLPT